MQSLAGGSLMGQSPNGRSVEFAKGLEELVRRIPDVSGVRVVAGSDGAIEEVHVLADPKRAPKQIVRDIQSAAQASFGLEIDYRTVSVVQLEGAATAQPDAVEDAGSVPLARPSLRGVALRTTGKVAHASVALAAGIELEGNARGPASLGLQLVARAVLDAVRGALDDVIPEVEYADLVSCGQHSVAVVVLRLATEDRDVAVSGSAVLRTDAPDAVARACLSALNRYMRI